MQRRSTRLGSGGAKFASRCASLCSTYTHVCRYRGATTRCLRRRGRLSAAFADLQARGLDQNLQPVLLLQAQVHEAGSIVLGNYTYSRKDEVASLHRWHALARLRVLRQQHAAAEALTLRFHCLRTDYMATGHGQQRHKCHSTNHGDPSFFAAVSKGPIVLIQPAKQTPPAGDAQEQEQHADPVERRPNEPKGEKDGGRSRYGEGPEQLEPEWPTQRHCP